MKKELMFIVVLVTSLIFGCAAFKEKLIENLNGGTTGSHNSISIYQGQSADSVIRTLGNPDVVSSGIFCKNKGNIGFGIRTARNTVEWVYVGTSNSTVIYLDHGLVSIVYNIPTSRIKR